MFILFTYESNFDKMEILVLCSGILYVLLLIVQLISDAKVSEDLISKPEPVAIQKIS